MLFLGTGAADTIPNAFCDCPICMDARINPMTSVRKRSMFMIDRHNLIDFGPDFSTASQIYNIMFTQLHNIFITHTHEDHFCESNFGLLSMSRTKPEKPIRIYISEKGINWLRKLGCLLDNDFGKHRDFVNSLKSKNVEFVPVMPYEEFMADELKVFAIETTHIVRHTDDGERAINYLFTLPDGKHLLYACDTGVYSRCNLDILKNADLDYLIMEATFGSSDNDNTSHLNAKGFIEMLNLMRENEIITDKTMVYATHINHKHDFNHERYQEFFDGNSPYPVTVARDGMEI